VDMVTRELADLRGSYALYGEGKKVLANETAFKEGGKNATAILKTIPEYRADMDYFDAAKLFISINSGPKPLTDDTKAKLGALAAHMTNEGCEVSDLSDLSHASEAVLTAAEHGATSVVALPQGVALRQMAEPTAWGGRCMPLVSLAALAESRGPQGAEGVMHRLEQETHDMRKTGRRDQSAYAQNLSTLHTLTKGVRSPIADAPGKPTVNLGHRNTVNHLATQFGRDRTKPVMYAVHVTNHVMMIGASSHNGKDSFTFYDPNFGTAKFASKEDLSRFLDDYFMKLEMGDSYGMKPKGGPDHHFTNVEQFDLGGLAALSIRGQKIETMVTTR
ncbi:MAG: YopT-type cysteine protease domain-containing protein, partial [Verrucomicrobium sp.]